MRKPAIIIIFLLGLILTLSMVKAVVYNGLSTSGTFVGEIEEQIEIYKTQNAILSEQLLIYSSLSNISEKASKLGFVHENSVMMLKTLPLAVKQ